MVKMKVKLIKQEGGKLVYEVSIDLSEKSMLTSEEQIQEAVNTLGNKATEAALSQFDTTGEDIIIDSDNYSSKSYEKKIPNALRTNRIMSLCISSKLWGIDVLPNGNWRSSSLSKYT